jgi:hypothetical protein
LPFLKGGVRLRGEFGGRGLCFFGSRCLVPVAGRMRGWEACAPHPCGSLALDLVEDFVDPLV